MQKTEQEQKAGKGKAYGLIEVDDEWKIYTIFYDNIRAHGGCRRAGYAGL